jgi:muramoyltetrapeptide carboxypeptidase
LTRAGYTVKVGAHVLGLEGYFPADDSCRAADFNAMVRDPKVKAIWFARGGYGSARILPLVDWAALRRSGKTFIGYSDITALALAALRKPGTTWLYGPVVTEMGTEHSHHKAGFGRLLAGKEDRIRFRKDQVLSAGKARGRLMGGNLTVLAHQLGTRWMPSMDQAILALEDVGEETYRLDRALTQLRLSRALDRIAGICLGRFNPPPARRRFPPDRSLEAMLQDILGDLGVPVVHGLPFGHIPGKRVLPLGYEATLDTSTRSLGLSPRPGK